MVAEGETRGNTEAGMSENRATMSERWFTVSRT